ncbi:MAG: response regulator, partial [Fibromonadaceae bacterium]|nr:response regulator [Fibromonadaceae bacterium]
MLYNNDKNEPDNMLGILNKSDAMVCVMDPETDEILFITDSMKRNFKIKINATGQLCYNILKTGTTKKCDFCPRYQLDKNPTQPIIWEEYNPLTQCHYRNIDRYVESSSGKKVHIQYAIDLTDIKQRDNMLHAVNQAASALLTTEGKETFEDSLLKGMEIIGRCANADCVEIWKNEMRNGELYAVVRHYWSCEKIPLEPAATAASFPYSAVPEWESKLSRGECIHGPLSSFSQIEQDFLGAFGIKSLLVMPVFIENNFWGMCCVDDYSKARDFTEEEINILRSGALLFTNALLRNEMIVSIRDTSIRLESALAQANAANKAKDEFLSKISHEIRTPMNAILGLTEVQLQNESLPQGTREGLSIIYNSGDSLLRIINDLLDLSKIEAKKLEIIPAKYEVASLINDTTQLNMLRIESKPIEFKLNVDENIPSMLLGDELRIKQILNNVLSNAFKYTDCGKVSMSVSAERNNDENFDTMLIFCISDTGHGMTKEQIRKIFDEYSRFNLIGNNKIEGTGLGMGITQSLIDLMKGNISVESEPGKGSVFTIRLPQKTVGIEILGKELAENLQNFSISSESQTKKISIVREPMPYGKVLIVDDVESNLYVAKQLLEPYDLSVDVATNGFEAIEKIKNGKIYDIVLMDHMMPNMDGIETTKRMRKLGYEHPIIALTANAVVGQAEMFLENDFDGFISKPIDTVLLNAELNKFIRDKKSPEALFKLHKTDATLYSIFIQDVKKALPIFEFTLKNVENISDNNLRLFSIKVHGIKSALANIGKIETSKLAFTLEKAGKEQDKDTIKAQT